MKKSSRFAGDRVSARGIYKGYTFADVSTPMENGRYRARVAIMALDGTRNAIAAVHRPRGLPHPHGGRRARRRGGAGRGSTPTTGTDELALPTNFSPLD
jgi:hypothetical protein